MLEKFHEALLANDSILFFDEHFSKVTFFANEMGIFIVDRDKICLDDDNSLCEGRSSHHRCSVRKSVRRNFAKIT